MTSIMDTTAGETTVAPVDPQRDYYDELVGEGKTFRDNQALARGKVESNEFIKQLQRELREAREDITRLAEQSRVDKRLEEIQGLLGRTAGTPNPTANQPTDTAVSPPEITEQRINDLLDARETQRRRTDNIKNAQKLLKDAFGSEVADKVKDKAKELDVGVDFLNTVAADNPVVFAKIMGIDINDRPSVKHAAPGPTLEGVTFAPPRNRLNADAFRPSNNTNDRTESYYDTMRRSKPQEYHTREIQWQMHNDAIRLGESFFDKSTPQ